MTPRSLTYRLNAATRHTQRAGSARCAAALARWLAATTKHNTQQGRAGRAGQALAIAGSKAGQTAGKRAGNGISNSEIKHLKKNFKVFCQMVLTFQKLCAYNGAMV